MTNVYHSLAGGSLTQNWTNNSLITTNDNWSGVPSIEGFLGDINAADPTNVDPLHPHGRRPGPDRCQREPSQIRTHSPPAAWGNSLAPSPSRDRGTADAPSLSSMKTRSAGRRVRVQFNARDLDGTADNSVQPLNVHYRIGDSGPWTNVTGALRGRDDGRFGDPGYPDLCRPPGRGE